MIEMHYSMVLGATIFRSMGNGRTQAEILRVPDDFCVRSPRVCALITELTNAGFTHRRPGSRYIETSYPKIQQRLNELAGLVGGYRNQIPILNEKSGVPA